MRKVPFTLLVLIGLAFLSTKIKAQSSESPVSYMNEIFKSVDESKNETWHYLKAVTQGKGARKVENKRQNLLNKLKETRYEVQRTGKYKSDDSLRNAVTSYLKFSYIVLKEDFGKILDMEDIAEQSYDLMEAYLLAKEKANDKLNASFDTVKLAQENFAKKHNITLTKAENDKTYEKIKKASETLKYYNEIYLIFFKSYKQEAYVLDAMSRNDINAFEQNTSTLSLYAAEGLDKVINLKGFKGDAILKIGVKKMLLFYKNEAENDFPAMTDFYIKKDNFEKINKKFETINAKKRTQQDVDQFNKAVNEYNEAAQKTNKISELSNNKRNKSLTEWNNTVDKFFDKYSN